MTVQVRPTPARTWGNSIKPFRSVKPGPQLPTYTLKTWKPPVPEPLPPAPLLGLPSLLALGALVLSQAWGLLGSRGAGRPSGSEPYYINLLATEITVRYRVDIYLDGEFSNYFSGTHFIGPGYTYDLPPDSEAVQVPSPPPWDTVLKVTRRIRITAPDGSYTEPTAINSIPSGSLESPVDGIYKTPSSSSERHEWSVRVVDGSPGGADPTVAPERLPGLLPSVPLAEPGSWSEPFPWITPEELAILRPRPLLLPDAEPLPDPANPQPQPTPLTVPAPLVAPTAPLLRPLPAGVQLLPGGTLPTPQAAAVPQTPQGTHYPATGLAIPANPPAPTLQGIAQEVGRVESKLNKLLNPATGNNFDRLELIYDTISGLFEFLTSITAGGSYTLEAPCETAEDGSPLVVEHTYDGALNSIGVLSNKIDAVAAMLQTVKNQKQPVCKAPPRQGQAVTVNFEEV